MDLLQRELFKKELGLQEKCVLRGLLCLPVLLNFCLFTMCRTLDRVMKEGTILQKTGSSPRLRYESIFASCCCIECVVSDSGVVSHPSAVPRLRSRRSTPTMSRTSSNSNLLGK